jgi:hypothetical protein
MLTQDASRLSVGRHVMSHTWVQYPVLVLLLLVVVVVVVSLCMTKWSLADP